MWSGIFLFHLSLSRRGCAMLLVFIVIKLGSLILQTLARFFFFFFNLYCDSQNWARLSLRRPDYMNVSDGFLSQHKESCSQEGRDVKNERAGWSGGCMLMYSAWASACSCSFEQNFPILWVKRRLGLQQSAILLSFCSHTGTKLLEPVFSQCNKAGF